METHRKAKINFNCEICGSTYERISALHNHLRQAHNTNIDVEELKRNCKSGEKVMVGGENGQMVPEENAAVAIDTELRKHESESEQVLHSGNNGLELEQLVGGVDVINEIHETTVATQSIIQSDGYFFMDQEVSL